MKKRHYILPIIVFLLLLAVYYFFKQESEIYSWKTFEKTEDSITSHITTNNELKKINAEDAHDKTRQQASKKTKKSLPLINGRRPFGDNIEEHLANINQLEFINHPDPNWQEKLAKQMLRFQDRKTKLFIKKEQGLIEIDKGKGRYVELVLITLQSENERPNSFRALVDGESGRMIVNWDRTKHFDPNIKKTHQEESIKPSGPIASPD